MLQIIFCIISRQVYLSKVMHKYQKQFSWHLIQYIWSKKGCAKDITTVVSVPQFLCAINASFLNGRKCSFTACQLTFIYQVTGLWLTYTQVIYYGIFNMMTNKYEVGSHQNKISRGVDSSEQETFVYR